jgi:hypothetical protein
LFSSIQREDQKSYRILALQIFLFGIRRIALVPTTDKKGEETNEYIVEEMERLPEQALSLSDDAYNLWLRQER